MSLELDFLSGKMQTRPVDPSDVSKLPQSLQQEAWGAFREGMGRESYPDHIDSNQHVNGVIAWDALEHSVGGVVASFSSYILWEWHFVHTQGTLEQGIGWGWKAAGSQLANSTGPHRGEALALRCRVMDSTGVVEGSGRDVEKWGCEGISSWVTLLA